MIGYIKGNVHKIDNTTILVSNTMMGFKLKVSTTTANREYLKPQAFYTHLHVTERDFILYGFISRQEEEMFLLIMSVPKIGGKIALSVLAHLSFSDFKEVIISENAAKLNSIPGIGKKTAEKIIFELRSKIKKPLSSTEKKECGKLKDVGSALINLGYKKAQVELTLKETYFEQDSLEGNIIKALKSLTSIE